MPGRFSLGQALVAALVVHVAVFAVAGHVHAAIRGPMTTEPALTLLPVEVEPETPVPTPIEPTEPALEPTQALAFVEPSTARPTRHTTEPPAASAVALPETAPATPGGWTLRVTTDRPGGQGSSPLAPLAIDGQNHFLGRRETPQEAQRAADEEANRAAGAAIRGALHDHDVALGLGGGGPVISALEAAVRESTAPDESSAILIAVADPSGLLLSVDVESATDGSSYRAVAEDVLRRLRGQHLRIPSGTRGLAMRIDVSSKLAAPSGGGVGLDPRHAGAQFDISDIGSRPRRAVKARVLAEQLL